MTAPAFYNLELRPMIKDLAAQLLRTVDQIAWLYCLCHPLTELYDLFKLFRSDAIYKLDHNCQICYLVAVLNDSFDPELRRIRLENIQVVEPLNFYEPVENEDIYFYEDVPEDAPVYFYGDDDGISTGADFTVMVPADLQPGTPEALNAFLIKMKGEIDYYKLYCKAYQIFFV